MTFWEHVEVFRKVLFRCIGVWAICAIGAFCFKDTLFAVLFAPSEADFVLYRWLCRLAEWTGWRSLCPGDFQAQFINTELASQFMVHLQVALIVGCIVAFPYLLIQLYGTKILGVSMLFNESRPSTWILPVLSLSIGNIAYYAMWLRRYMVDESNKDYVRFARAKGVNESKIVYRHILRNAIVPLAQYIPQSILLTIAGSIYVENLYSVPGMGGLLIQVIKMQDNTMVQALVLIYASVSILGLLVGDLVMALLDPRIMFTKKEGARQ